MTLLAPVVYRIWINALPPKLANRKNNHWAAYHRERQIWMALAVNALRHQIGNPEAQRVAVKVIAHVPKVSDQDNADSYIRKACHDLLVVARIIPDDGAAFLVAHPVEQKVVGSKPREPKSHPEKYPDYGKRMMAHLKKLGVMIDVTVLA